MTASAVGARLPLTVQRLDGDDVAAGDIGIDTGDGQAAFLVHLLAVASGDARVDEDQWPAFVLAHVNHHEALVHIHLAGGQANPGGGVHGFKHVVEQGLEGRRGQFRRSDVDGFGAQARVGKFKDREQGHGGIPVMARPEKARFRAIVSRSSCMAACQRPVFVGSIYKASGGFNHRKRGDSDHV